MEIQKVYSLEDLMVSLRVSYKDDPFWLRNGLEKAIEDMVARCRKYNRSGSVSVDFNFAPERGTDNEMRVSAALKIKEPPPVPQEMIAWTDNKGRLCMTDPNQPPIPGLTPFVEMKRAAANDKD